MRIELLGLFGALSLPLKAEPDLLPSDIQFRRQAVKRLMFDADQNTPLASLRPASIVDLSLMHPEMMEKSGIIRTRPTNHLFLTPFSTRAKHGPAPRSIASE